MAVDPAGLLPQVRTPRPIASATLIATQRDALLAGQDPHLRGSVGMVGEDVRVGTAQQGDVTGVEPGGLARVEAPHVPRR